MKRFFVGLAVIALVAAGCSSGSDSAKSAKNDDATGACPTNVVANPDDGGKTIPALIASATKSVDIIIYQIGDPDIQSALLAAMANGVEVRVSMDNYSSSTATPNTAFVNAMVTAATAASPSTLSNFQANWSSSNFNITHQKTVIIDGNGGGAPCLLISTGNFYSSSYGKYWAARDFYVTTGDPSLISQAESVFSSDFSCDGDTVTNGILAETSGPLLYSNGSFLPGTSTYPPYNDGYYPGGSPISTPGTNQGNVGPYQVALIDSATKGDVISIYNEELKSDTNSTGELWYAIMNALDEGVSVQIFMSAPPSQSKNPLPDGQLPDGQDKDFVTLAAAGASVHLLAAEAYLQESSTGFPSGNPTYIHAKAFLLNDSAGNFIDGYVGSTNGSSNSIYFNRELGLALKNYPALAKSIQATFTKDFSIANPAAPAAPFNFTVPKVAPATGGLYPVAWYAKGSSPQSAALTDGGYSTFARQACGAAFTPPATTTSAAAATTTTTSSSTTSTSSTTTTTKGS